MALDVYVEDPSSVGSSSGSGDTSVSSANAASPAEEAAADGGSHAKAALLQRWQDRCDGATVDIKVVVDESGGRRRDSSSPHPSATPRNANRLTLFHQEAELAAVHTGDDNDRNCAPARYLLLLRTEFELTVRSEYWDRPLALIARVTPKDAATGKHPGLLPKADPLNDPVQSGALLSDEWLATRLLPLIREETTPAVSLTKRLECPITVVKPLQVQVETRALNGRRVGVIVKALNARADIVLEVLDLQLHLNDSSSASSVSKDQGNSSTRRYELVDGSKAPFPVSLLAHERYNFLFVLEPMDPPVREPAAAGSPHSAGHPNRTSGHARDEPTRMAAAAVSASNLHRWNSAPSRGSVSSIDGSAVDDGPEHALLTLTWMAKDSVTRAITEQHTIVWSPFALSLGSASSPSSSAWMAPPRAEWSRFVVPQSSAAELKAIDPSSVSFVTLRDDSALHVALVPPASPPRVGQVATACVAVTNRSQHATFDLTLVLPCQPRKQQQQQQGAGIPGDSPDWISFEASHHLGYVFLTARLVAHRVVSILSFARLRSPCLSIATESFVDGVLCVCLMPDWSARARASARACTWCCSRSAPRWTRSCWWTR